MTLCHTSESIIIVNVREYEGFLRRRVGEVLRHSLLCLHRSGLLCADRSSTPHQSSDQILQEQAEEGSHEDGRVQQRGASSLQGDVIGGFLH